MGIAQGKNFSSLREGERFAELKIPLERIVCFDNSDIVNYIGIYNFEQPNGIVRFKVFDMVAFREAYRGGDDMVIRCDVPVFGKRNADPMLAFSPVAVSMTRT